MEHQHTLSTEPHITVQVLPHTAGAHLGLLGQFSVLEFRDSRQTVVYLERFTSGLRLERPAAVQQYNAMHARVQNQALSPDHTRHFITEATKLRPFGWLTTAGR
ncbi:Scr1 family TA system antitoxin-like transcriptional regulator [Streptomyces sp. NPDC087219]|uniref:Scr1 family TA system antitoxin-like transcriptional regulator n=1 Tax=Streptomyces sp. NPDC087219 TaxID=3365770 RepID=UPI003820C125